MSKGIYCIRNALNNKRYIGQTSKSFKSRWYNHRYTLTNNKHDNQRLQNAWNKYGEENFIFEVLEEIKNVELLTEREQYFADTYDTFRNGYNMKPCVDSSLGFRHSKKTKEKLSNLAKSRNLIGKKNPWYGKGSFQSGDKNPFYGKTHSEEARKLIGQKSIGRSVGEKSPLAKLTWEKVREIREKYKTGLYTHLALSLEYDVSRSNIGNILANKRWKE